LFFDIGKSSDSEIEFIEEVKNDKEIGNENCHASKILKNFMFDSKFNLFNKNDF
jgi:hypothetical protein